MTCKDFSVLTKKKPEKRLLKPLKRMSGRGSSGRITVRHKGGGAKRQYRIVDFDQKKLDVKAKVIALEYDPNRTAYISLIEYPDGEKRYMLAPYNIKIGTEISFSDKGPISIGNRMRLENIPVGTIVYNIELEPGRGGKLARGAGVGATVLAHENKFIHLKMPSSEIRKVPDKCFASIGQVSCPEHRFINVGKAGRSRYKGIKPTVRGSAMSAYDHPHGGGEGRAPIGLKHPKTPWGKIARGVKTRRKKKRSNKLILQRRSKRK